MTAITLESPDITTILTHRIKETGEAIELYCKILVNSHEMSIPLRDVLQPTTNLTNTKYLVSHNFFLTQLVSHHSFSFH